MRKLVLIAAMLMASASAQAGNSFSFSIEGHKVRVNIPRNCASLSCISISAPSLTETSKNKDEGAMPPAAKVAAPPAAAPAAPPPPPPTPSAPAAQSSPQAVTTPSPQAPDRAQAAPATAGEPVAVTVPAPAPVETAARTSPQAQPQVVAATPAAPPVATPPASIQIASPIGIWLSEKKEGTIRIEDCNGNLCGYAVDGKTGANAAKVLINMKPRGDKWAGRIHDTRSGGTYDSTIALRGTDKLRVQGCAFGGMVCGGEIWTRVQ